MGDIERILLETICKKSIDGVYNVKGASKYWWIDTENNLPVVSVSDSENNIEKFDLEIKLISRKRS